MSVRRLAEKQPESFEFTPQNKTWLEKQIAKYPDGRQASVVVPALWQAQKQNDYWLPRAAIEKVAETLGMPDIRVLEIATFYSMFNLEPVGKYYVQLCGTTPCMLRGSDDIIKVLERRVGPQRKVSADGLFSWLEVECLGACCNAPMVQINDDYYEDLTPETSGPSALESFAFTLFEVATSGEPSGVQTFEYACAVLFGRVGRMIASRSSQRSAAGRSITRSSPRNSRR